MNDAVAYGDAREPERSDSAVAVGDVLAGRYRVVEAIGAGGMARVFLARDEALGRRVALKVLRSDVADGATSDRAEVETRLLASLNHPGLVTLFDAHLTHEPRFLVMEHVVGSTLAVRIAGGPLAIHEVAALAGQLADALHVVHDAGIVHRDVKPSNILLARSTTPGVPLRAKLADFGIAHLLDGERVTSPSLVIGTAAYIAPELLSGAEPAPPSDIYALGLVVLEAATGVRAFEGSEGNRGQLLARLSRDPAVSRDLAPPWRELLQAMTAREPCDRPNAHEVMARVAEVSGGAARDAVTSATGDAERRASLAAIATAAYPVVPPAPAVPAPVAARAPGRGGTAPTLVAALPTALASAPDRVAAAGSARRRRRRLATAVSAVSAAAVIAVIAASVLVWRPATAPTTDPVEIPSLQTPSATPTDAASGEAGDERSDGDDESSPATGTTTDDAEQPAEEPGDTRTVDAPGPTGSDSGRDRGRTDDEPDRGSPAGEGGPGGTTPGGGAGGPGTGGGPGSPGGSGSGPGGTGPRG